MVSCWGSEYICRRIICTCEARQGKAEKHELKADLKLSKCAIFNEKCKKVFPSSYCHLDVLARGSLCNPYNGFPVMAKK